MPRINSKNRPISNRIAAVIAKKEKELNDAFKFAPANSWYTTIVEVGKKDFGKMLRNLKQPTLTQLQIIAETLDCSVNDLIEQHNVAAVESTEHIKAS